MWKTEQKASGYGYSYSKVITILRNDPLITIEHTLKNTGEKRIVTDFYNHNFFNVDGDPVGPNYSFAFPFEPKAQDLRGKFAELVELKDKQLRFKDKLPTDQFVMAGLTGFDPKEMQHQVFEMRHAPSGVRIEVRHTYPFAKFNVWGIKTTICPEPHMAIDLKPGESLLWGIGYDFNHDPPKK
jgi:galactose mutarotase-like enzyme